MSKGVVIYAFKKAAYGKLAFNLALSIRYHSPGIKIALVHDHSAVSILPDWQMNYFDHKITIDESDLYHNGKFSPGKAKISGYKYFPFDENMVIDADSLVINPLEPLFDMCKKDFHAQTCGKWDQTGEAWSCTWMKLQDVKTVFELPEKYEIFEINSSFVFARKSATAQGVYDQAFDNMVRANDSDKLKVWGGSFPDELAFNVAFAQKGVNPGFSHIQDPNNGNQWPVFFSTAVVNDWGFVHHNYYVLGLFGGRNFTHESLVSHYDRLMAGYANHFGFPHYYKMPHIMKQKHAGNK